MVTPAGQRSRARSTLRPALRPRAVAWALAMIPVIVTVATYGELTVQALVSVLLAGALIGGLALRRRSGSACAPVGVAGLSWAAWLVASSIWELAMFLDPSTPTLSDLMDPVLAHPLLRAAATAGWLAAGLWLLARPRQPATVRTPA